MKATQRSWILKRLIAAFGVGLVALLALPGVAQADEDDWKINRYELVADAAKNGETNVKITFDFDYADSPGHGPYVTVPEMQEIDGDKAHYRSFEVDDIEASSPTGAPTDISTEHSNGALAIRLGDEDKEVEGVQTYEVSYTIKGIVNPGAGASDEDEINWNVISQWDVPISNINIQLNGPADAADATCFAGAVAAKTECGSATVDGKGAVFTQDLVKAGDGLTVVTSWPAGSFVGAEPIIKEHRTLGNTFTLNPLTGGLTALVAVLGGGGFLWLRRKKGHDQQFAGVTPGLTPGAEGATVQNRDRNAPVAVQFTPPKDVPPGVMGTLIDGTADNEDVTATIVDLAVRGHLRIEETVKDDAKIKEGEEPKEDDKDWRLVKLQHPGQLDDFEQTILDGLFDDEDSKPEKDGQEEKDSVNLSELSTNFAKAHGETRAQLYESITERGWYPENPSVTRAKWYSLAVGITIVGIAATVLLAIFAGWGLLGLGIVVVGIVAFIVAGKMVTRTAEGTAVHAQSLGFQTYLETAEGDQLKFEEGEDIFSRYLPYAIVFGVAERWAKVFGDLAAQGRNVPEPTWYVGSTGQTAFFAGAFSSSFADSLGSFTSAASTSMTQATSGSSGGSGFSGGSVGGGVGGGGGGGW